MTTRTLKKLGKKYGKLTVIAEETYNSRRTAIVNCKCGVQKRVNVDALTSGRTKSCGAPACRRTRSLLRSSTRYIPRGSKEIPLATLRKIVAATTRERSPITVAAAAKAHGIDKIQTLYSALRAVRKCGGIDEYARRVR
jgi:hypothetical protein